MWTIPRALAVSADSGRPLPPIEGLEALYERWTPRAGSIVMIAGRSGTMKSALAAFLCAQWNLPTLYVSGDMSMRDAAIRFAQMLFQRSLPLVEADLEDPERKAALLNELTRLNVQLVPESPITFQGIASELEAWVELHNAWPEIIVIDNLMDLDGGEADYAAQMAAMQEITSLARGTGAMVIVLHHARERDAEGVAFTRPPSRMQIKNGLSEKSEVCLTVGLDADTNRFQIAVVKQRAGKSDPNAIDPVSLKVEPSHLHFSSWSL